MTGKTDKDQGGRGGVSPNGQPAPLSSDAYPKPLLEVDALTKSFSGLRAVSDVSFSVGIKEIVGLVGPNGAGKTTLFNPLSGVLAPTSGCVRFKGETISGIKAHKICHLGLTRTFQHPHTFHQMSAVEFAAVGAMFGGQRLSNRNALNQANEILNKLKQCVITQS